MQHERLSEWGIGLRTLSVAGSFAATIVPPHGIAFCKLPENDWISMSLSTNLDDNSPDTLVIDDYALNHLWIGGRGKITVLDMDTQHVIGECKSQPG